MGLSMFVSTNANLQSHVPFQFFWPHSPVPNVGYRLRSPELWEKKCPNTAWTLLNLSCRNGTAPPKPKACSVRPLRNMSQLESLEAAKKRGESGDGWNLWWFIMIWDWSPMRRIDDDLGWSMMIFDDSEWFMMIWDVFRLPMMIYHDLGSPLRIYDDLEFPLMIFDDLGFSYDQWCLGLPMMIYDELW